MSNRRLSIGLAVAYALVVTAAPLFHSHPALDGGGCCHGDSPVHALAADCHHDSSDADSSREGAPQSPVRCSDGEDCPVCHFLGQKPVPTAEVAAVCLSSLAQEVSSPAPVIIVVRLFSAWHSRAPPVFA
jgi:hypothetical protein